MAEAPLTVGERHLLHWVECLQGPQFVYVLRAEADRPVKIGTTYDVPARLRVLQTGNPRRLRLVRIIPAGQPFEALLHRYMAGTRLIGEWFDGARVGELLEHLAAMGTAMIAAHDGNPVPPDYQEFTDWIPLRLRRPQTEWERSSPVTVRHVEPEPVPPDVSARGSQERWLRPWETLPEA